MTLSILISSKRERKNNLDQLLAIIIPQFTPVMQQVEVLINKDLLPTHAKRNELAKSAKGTYVWFINDGDWIAEYAIAEVLSCAQSGCDCLAMNGVVTTNGKNPVDFQMRVEHQTQLSVITGDKEILLKPLSFNAPIRRELVLSVPFTNKAGSWPIRELIKTQEIIQKPIYHFRHWT
jgi:hypothetical protein